MHALLTWTDCDEAADFVMPNVLSPRDIVSSLILLVPGNCLQCLQL